VWSGEDFLQVKPGSWPHLVKRGGLEVSRPFPLHQRARKTATLLRGSFSTFLIEVPTLSTSPNVAKSLKPSKSVDMIRGYTTTRSGNRIALRRLDTHLSLPYLPVLGTRSTFLSPALLQANLSPRLRRFPPHRHLPICGARSTLLFSPGQVRGRDTPTHVPI
jgi:hypothetical protein